MKVKDRIAEPADTETWRNSRLSLTGVRLGDATPKDFDREIALIKKMARRSKEVKRAARNKSATPRK